MLIQGYQLYFQICLLYFYECKRCAANPQLHYASNRTETNSFLNRRPKISLLQQNELSKGSAGDLLYKGNEEESQVSKDVHFGFFPNSVRPITVNSNNKETINYQETLSKYSILPLRSDPIRNNDKQHLTSNIMERDPDIFPNTDIVYVSNEELLPLFNLYIDVAMSNHHRPVVHHRPFLTTLPTSGQISYAPFKLNPSTNPGNLVANGNAILIQKSKNIQNHFRSSHVTLQPDFQPTFPINQHQQETLHQSNEVKNSFKPVNDLHSLEPIDSVGSPSISDHYKGQDDENFSRKKSLVFPNKKINYNPEKRIQWTERANNNSLVPFLDNSSSYEKSGKEIKQPSKLKNEDQIGNALLNLINNITAKQGLKVESDITDNHIEIKIFGTPQRKIRLRKGRKRQKPFQRGPLIQENFPPKYSSPNKELNYFNSFNETFESKRMNSLDSSTNEKLIKVSNLAKEIEIQSSKTSRHPKSIQQQDAFHLNPKQTKKINDEINDSNETYSNNGIKLKEQSTVKRRLPFKKFRKAPKLEFPFPRSFLSGMSFLIKGYENLGPHIIIKEGQ